MGVAVYEGRGFKYNPSSEPTFYTLFNQLMESGLEDYCWDSLYHGELLNPINMGHFPITTYSGPEDEETERVLEGEIQHKFENGKYYRIAPCIFISTESRVHKEYYVEPRSDNMFVCHWPYTANGDLLIEPEED